MDVPWRRDFDAARDPYTARNALGITSLGGGGGAPTNAEYITAATDPTLTAERVLTNTASITWDFSTPGQAKASTTAGGGNVSNSGTPTSGQYAKWVTATTIQGVAPATVLSDIGALSDAVSDGNIYGRKDAAWVEVTSGGSPLGEFVFSSNTSSPPGGGQIRLNSASQTLATRIYISGTSAPGVDAYQLLATFLSVGGRIYLQTKGDSTKWIKLQINSISLNTTWIDCAISYFSGPGGLPNGQRTIMYVSQAQDLSFYAPLASPTFTGDPQAPTPATGDNDTSIATTAFVKAQGYLTDAVSDGNYYSRRNAAWAALGTMAIQNANAVAITGGTIDGCIINGGTF